MISLVLYKFYKCTVSVSEGPTIHYSHARTYLYLTAPDALATAASASAAAAASLAVCWERNRRKLLPALQRLPRVGVLVRWRDCLASWHARTRALRVAAASSPVPSVCRLKATSRSASLVAQPTASLTPEICRSNDRPCSPARRPSPWTSRPPSLI